MLSLPSTGRQGGTRPELCCRLALFQARSGGPGAQGRSAGPTGSMLALPCWAVRPCGQHSVSTLVQLCQDVGQGRQGLWSARRIADLCRKGFGELAASADLARAVAQGDRMAATSEEAPAGLSARRRHSALDAGSRQSATPPRLAACGCDAEAAGCWVQQHGCSQWQFRSWTCSEPLAAAILELLACETAHLPIGLCLQSVWNGHNGAAPHLPPAA